MNDCRYASTTRVAAALGVSTTTIKRWVDEGVLRAERTVGGHRRLLVADVLRVARAGNFPRLDVRLLGLPRRGQTVPPLDALAAQLFMHLSQGNAGATRLLIDGTYQSGVPVFELADDVIAPALAQIGQEWEAGRLDVWHEHRATQLCAAPLYALLAELEQTGRPNPPLAVGGGPEGDPYLLANLLAELVLREGGWRVVNLGPNTPLLSFHKALIEFRPRLMWLSVNYLAAPAEFACQYEEFYRTAARCGAAVAIGGRGLTEAVRAALPYTTYGDRMAHLAAFAHSLHAPGQATARRKSK